MPVILKSEEFINGIMTVRQLHPTFAAEVRGVDLSTAPTEEVFAQILAAVTQVN